MYIYIHTHFFIYKPNLNFYTPTTLAASTLKNPLALYSTCSLQPS